MKGRITGISLAEHRVTVEDGKGKVKTFKLAFDAKMKADKKTERGQKKDITIEDFQTGQQVKVVFRDSDEAAVELKMLPR